MKRLKDWQKVLLGCVVVGGVAVGVLVLGLWNLGRSHRHCIKNAGSAFRMYAGAHGGVFPFHTNGFGDALAALAVELPDYAHSLVGVDHNADWLLAAGTNKVNVSEDRCTRIYVQGLSDTNNPEIAILFDRYAVKGGDHFRGIPGQRHLREVSPISGGMWSITADRWPAFASNQVELLVKEGIPRATAEAYYKPTLDPNALR